MWFDNPYDVARVAIVGPAAYAILVLFLRLSGKRTLSSLNAFDFVVTVALGSTLATIVLSKDVSFVEGGVALALLVLLQYVVATASVRFVPLRRLVKSEPTLVVRRGEVIHEAMHKERLNITELHQALRSKGIADLGDVDAVVLETDGSLSIVADAGPDASTMVEVDGWGAGGIVDRDPR